MTVAQHEVAVVGAGLAGLACAVRLSAGGRDVVVLEAGDAVGGRVRTDVVDGYRCDRGFQLLNPAYPEVLRLHRSGSLDEAALDLRPFDAGVVVARRGRRWRLCDPRRTAPGELPAAVLQAALAPLGGPVEKLSFVRWAVLCSTSDVRRLLDGPDTTLAEGLDAAGVTGGLRRAVVEPFLAGTLADDSFETSHAFARLLVRSFVRGRPGVPAAGMQMLPELLASNLPAGAVRLGCPVSAVTPTSAATPDGVVAADAVVVATDPVGAAVLADLPTPRMRALTTFWHACEEAPTRRALLHVDGDRRGPLVNTAVMTTVSPGYAPQDRHLVASTVLGDRADAETEQAVLAQLERVYGTGTSGWQRVAAHAVPAALPAVDPPLHDRKPVELESGLVVAGDHRDTSSIQGALVSGRRAADAVLARLGVRA